MLIVSFLPFLSVRMGKVFVFVCGNMLRYVS